MKKGAWAAVANAGSSVLQFAATIILSRFLSPNDFGIFAVLSFIYFVWSQVAREGFAASVMQSSNLTRGDASDLFCWLAFASGVYALFIFALSRQDLSIVGAEGISPYLTALAGLITLDGLTCQHRALVLRARMYEVVAAAQIASSLVALWCGVALATSGFGVWSLIVHLAVSTLISNAFYIIVTGWVPKWSSSFIGNSALLSFSVRMSAALIVNILYQRSLSSVLFFLGGAAQAGFFSRGSAVFSQPFQQLGFPITSLLLPTMAKKSSGGVEIATHCIKVYILISALCVPFIYINFFYAEFIVVALIGEKWLDAAPVAKWLAIAAFPGVLKMPLSAANAAVNRPGRALGVKAAFFVPFLIVLVVTAPKGAGVLAMAVCAFYIFMLPFEIYFLMRGFPEKQRELLLVVTQTFLIFCGCFLFSFLFAQLVPVLAFERSAWIVCFVMMHFILVSLFSTTLYALFPSNRVALQELGSRFASALRRLI